MLVLIINLLSYLILQLNSSILLNFLYVDYQLQVDKKYICKIHTVKL